MASRAGLLAVGLLLLFVSPAAAELTTGQWLVGGGGGLVLPSGDYKDASKTGYNLGLRVDYMAMPELAVGADFGYNRNNFSDDLVAALDFVTGTTIEGHYTVMQYTAHATALLSPGKKTRPYLTAGVGPYNVKAKATGTIPGGSVTGEGGETKAGVTAAAGVLFQAGSSAHVGFEGSFHNIFTEGSSLTYFNLRGLVLFGVGGK